MTLPLMLLAAFCLLAIGAALGALTIGLCVAAKRGEEGER